MRTDNLHTYTEEYNSAKKDLKDKTIIAFKLAKKEHKNFNTFLNKTIENLYALQKRHIDDFNTDNLKASYYLFENRYKEYNNDLSSDEIIELILDNEISIQLVPLGGKVLNNFIKNLAKQQAVFDIQNHLNNYREYYKLIFKHGTYDYFYDQNFKKYNFKYSEEYTAMACINMIDEKNQKPNKSFKQ